MHDPQSVPGLPALKHPAPRDFPGGLRVYFTTDPADRQQALGCRYRVFTLEHRRENFADHARQVYADETDNGPHHLLVVRSGANVVATLRCVVRREQVYERDEVYEIPDLNTLLGRSEPFQIAEIALADRGVILPEFRGRGLYDQMWEMIYEFCRLNGISVLLGILLVPRLLKYHHAQGWVTYLHDVPWSGDVSPTANIIAKLI